MLNQLLLPNLPICAVLDELKSCLSTHHQVVLEAPPGAGKTTVVPLALLHEPWLQQKRIIMLEPRRMAARAAAMRMASLLNETVGQTVGYRIKQDTRVSQHSRIEVITEGILTRMLIDDPSLDGVALVIFDEYHERSLDADFGLALALQSRELFRENDNPLRLIIMSATLDAAPIASLLNNAPLIRSEGKMFPVEIVYGKSKRFDDNIVALTVATVMRVFTELDGNILVFLPGQKEIIRAQKQLNEALSALKNHDCVVLPLYGALPILQQQRAIEAQDTTRKIVLATDIAETSLTIEGVNIVVDSGLTRQPCFDPGTGMSRLQTKHISQSSSTQRMGRAGRLRHGVCYRLWSKEQQNQLPPHSTAEILQADLTPLVLQMLAWGIDDISELQWLDSPPAGPIKQALKLLHNLGAIAQHNAPDLHTENTALLAGWRLTTHGEKMSQLPTHPRLAHMLIFSQRYQLTATATCLAALLSERSPLKQECGADIALQIAVVQGHMRCHSQHNAWLKRIQLQAKSYNVFNKQSAPISTDEPTAIGDNSVGFLLACAYPDRIAQRKSNQSNQYLLSNGRTAMIDSNDAVSNNAWLVVADVGGNIGQGIHSHNQIDRIFTACQFEPTLLQNQLSTLVNETDSVFWDESADRFIAERIRSVGKLVLSRTRIDNIPTEEKRAALVQLLQKRELSLLPWNKVTRQWQARINLLRSIHINDNDLIWPDVSDQRLADTADQWLGPHLDTIDKLSDFQKLDVQQLLNALLPWSLTRQLNELTPTTITVPSGSNIDVDYTHTPPVLSVKLQEMFGCVNTPCIANGKIKLMLHLLSPARRPLQVTQDLAGFWRSSYFDVKKEMKGRYPKHPWPDDPLQAIPTKFTKNTKH